MSESQKKVQIIPAIIPESYEDLAEKIARVSGLVTTVQIDVTDGKFAPTITWPYDALGDTHWKSLIAQDEGLPGWQDVDFEIDLMVLDQIKQAENWINAGVSRVVAHFEAMNDSDFSDLFNLKEKFNVEIYLAIIPSTPLSDIEKYLDKIDGVQFMGNDKIGYHGVGLDEKVYEKIRELRALKPNMPIGVDIGVNLETAPKLISAGATRLASGSMIFNAEDPASVIHELEGKL